MPGLRASCFPDRARSRRHSLKLGFATDRGDSEGNCCLKKSVSRLITWFVVRVDFGAVSEFDLI